MKKQNLGENEKKRTEVTEDVWDREKEETGVTTASVLNRSAR